MTRRIVVVLLALFGLIAATSCTQQQIDLWNTMGHDQQVAVAAWINEQNAPGDCRGAAHAVFPAHLHGWTDKIISRESGGNPAAQNRSSSAAGCFQIVKGTWNANAACDWSQRYNAMCNAKTAWIIYQRSGGSPWVTNY
jgi:hypothetical protein